MTTPAGWYDDGNGALRWWDGAQWTAHTRPVADAATDAATAVAVADPGVQPADPGVQPAAPQYVVPTGPAELYGGQPPAPPRSRLWIILTVVGVVLIALIVAAAIVIPRLVGNPNGGGTTGETGTTADEQAAVATVNAFDDAYDTGSCEAYQRATTENFRENGGLVLCDDFEDQSEVFSTTVSDYRIDVTSVETSGDTILVTTTETYLSSVDGEGNELDPPQEFEDELVYSLVQQDGLWKIDTITT